MDDPVTVPDLQRVVLEIFGGCNYSCPMCPQTTGREPSFTRMMPMGLFTIILDQIVQYGTPVVNLDGSGEPTMAANLSAYIQACTDRGLRTFINTNGARLNGDYMRRVIDAGLSFVRFSHIGYDRETYRKWMNVDNYDLIHSNIREMQSYIDSSQSKCRIGTYHLILDPENQEEEIRLYRENVIDPLGTLGYIWKMHNWSGNSNPEYTRMGSRKSCGRPFAAELTVRAGGLDGHRGAVTPCCQTLGPPNESLSVLGHLDVETIAEVWNGPLYQDLRMAHATGEFDRIEYCRNCDFLIDDPEVLVWSNDPNARVNSLLGTNLNLRG